jgi:hypothetical protein
VTIVSPHIVKVIAEERITDLHRDAAPRPEATPRAKRTRRLKRSAKRTQTISVVRTEQR